MPRLNELQPNRIYDTFSFSFFADKPNDTDDNDRNINFKIHGKFTGDQVAGMYVAVRAMMNSIIFDNEYDYRDMCVHCGSGSYARKICSSDGDDIMLNFLRNYIIYTVRELTNSVALANIPYDRYGMWMQNPVTYMYELVVFDSSEFIQGFITICNAFQVDYHDYVIGNIAKYDNMGNAILYQVSQN
jgi:hypothetical protein